MPIASYKCELCKRSFDNLKSAAACEKNHVKIKSAKIISHAVAGIYPPFVELEFTNGGKELYMLEKEAYYNYKK